MDSVGQKVRQDSVVMALCFWVTKTILRFSDLLEELNSTQQCSYTHSYGLLQQKDTD